MLFNSFEFLIFFPLVTLLYFVLPHKYRWFLLLIASCIFYMSFIPAYLLILFLLIIVDFYAAKLIEDKPAHRKGIFLTVSILSTIFVLFIFKYFNFFNANLAWFADMIGWNYSIKALSLILPIGLSFHTFQSLSYVIEVYRGRQKAERKFGIYALYVMFYPQLVAGPIERPQNLLHQFHEEKSFNKKDVLYGLEIMLWGFFKKIVVADRLAMVVNTVYNNPTEYTGLPLIIATIFFAFQIYCDFSGYSDIARGIARVMGFKLMVNFRRPYYARSIGEFWNRWHISLSTWFKDYVYIPLGGNRVPVRRIYLNLLIVFLVSGLWHGANWTFIVWGLLNGIFLVIENITRKYRESFYKNTFISKYPKTLLFIEICITFVLINITWIFFRANTMSDALYILTHLFKGWTFDLYSIKPVGISKSGLVIAITSIFMLESIQFLQERIGLKNIISQRSRMVRWAIYIIFLLLILLFGIFNNTQFIYFQF